MTEAPTPTNAASRGVKLDRKTLKELAKRNPIVYNKHRAHQLAKLRIKSTSDPGQG
ncbi:MAG: hypothetical protein WBM41_09360 [Arenicellales bacterium]